MEESVKIGNVVEVRIVEGEEKVLKKLGDLSFGIVIAAIASVFADNAVKNITDGDLTMFFIGGIVAIISLISGIIFYKIGGLR